MSLAPRIDRLDRNALINGDFAYWQRGTGATQLNAAPQYLGPDRFGVNRTTSVGGSGTTNITRQADVPTVAQAGYAASHSVRIRTSATHTTSDSNVNYFFQRIEGNRLRRFVGKKGYLSFWAKGNKLGTYTLAARQPNSPTNRFFRQSFAISESLVWKKYQFEIDFTSESAMALDNSFALEIAWVLQSSATSPPTTSSFVDGGTFAVTGQVNMLDTAGNDLFITMACLTEYPTDIFVLAGRDYQEELQLCQRYFEKSYDLDIVPGATTASGAAISQSAQGTCQYFRGNTSFKQTKRATPTMVLYNPNTGVTNSFAADSGSVTAGLTNISTHAASFGVNNITINVNVFVSFHYTADAEL